MKFIKTTEQDSKYNHLEKMSVSQILENINTEDKTVPYSVERALPQIEALVNQIVEKLMALTAYEKIACPIVVSSYSGHVLNQIPTPADKTSREIAEISFSIIIEHLKEIELAYQDFEKYEIITKGMDDLLGSQYSQLETFVYFLQRKLK